MSKKKQVPYNTNVEITGTNFFVYDLSIGFSVEGSFIVENVCF